MSTSQQGPTIRRRFDLRGQVQGVGFRPFVYRLAAELSLAGYVANNSNGAVIEVEGPVAEVETFEAELTARLPPLARVSELHRRTLAPCGESGFSIRPSESQRWADEPSAATAAGWRPEVTPDAATCADCLRELFDPADRRWRYPFINCTNCGPRYSIIRTVPYDRPATTMAEFRMCARCAREYSDPAHRRFHAQPNACPLCGPQLQLCSVRKGGSEDGVGELAFEPIAGDPIRAAAALLKEGRILAVKGIGGYHLACRADREDVVCKLRERKLRDGKPLAVMVPSVEAADKLCRLTPTDRAALLSPAAPIVLAESRAEHGLASGVAPGVRTFGVMLPYTPVHHLLFAEDLGPLVMTSANLAGQPLTHRDQDALRELHDVADAFLIHDREIFRPIDDSVIFTFGDEVVPIRRARGYAPRPLPLPAFQPGGRLAAMRERRLLAVGGELKATVCLLGRGEAILSEHLGDLTSPQAYRNFVQAVDRLKQLFGFEPQAVVHDLHPQYLSTHYARRLGLPAVAVQHHHAHVASVMAEWDEPGPLIGLACDGTGYGSDGAVWGCEVLLCQRGEFERVGHLEYFPLVGGDAAAVETWRPAAALLRQAYGDDWPIRMQHVAAGRSLPPTGGPGHPVAADVSSSAVLRQRATPDVGAGLRPGRGLPTGLHSPDDLAVVNRQMAAGVNAPPTSSLGRLFDAVSFLLGLCSRNRHEAEAAMALEAAAANCPAQPYPYELGHRDGLLIPSPRATIRAIVQDLAAGRPATEIAAAFHETVAQMLVEAAAAACEAAGTSTVALSGGCFANRRLLTRMIGLLAARRLRVLYHRIVPTGDGGLSLGQAWLAAWQLADA